MHGKRTIANAIEMGTSNDQQFWRSSHRGVRRTNKLAQSLWQPIVVI